MNTENVLAFFSGKSLEKARVALANVAQSATQGYWTPGVSRSARAALSKSTVAKKVVKDVSIVGGFSVASNEGDAFFRVRQALEFGYMVPETLKLALAGLPLIQDRHPEIAAFFRAYAAAFIPLGEEMERLDNARPIPVFTTMKASPTVSRTLTSLNASDAHICPMDFSWEERVNKVGVTITVPICTLMWPAGTKHNTSRYGGCQCQACGHAIRNGDNWIPMVLTTSSGPKSLWVGRDCAKTLFGVNYKGTLEINDSGKPSAA